MFGYAFESISMVAGRGSEGCAPPPFGSSSSNCRIDFLLPSTYTHQGRTRVCSHMDGRNLSPVRMLGQYIRTYLNAAS